MRRAVLVPLALALVAVDVGAIGGPLGNNDAGSGRDAGDVALLAVPIVPGAHQGHLALGDSFDHYRFDAAEGEVLVFSVEAAVPFEVGVVGPGDWLGVGSTVAAVKAGQEARFPVYATGTWGLQVNNQVLLEGDYVLRLAVVAYAAHGVLRAGPGWQAAEMRWDLPADVVFFGGFGGGGGEVFGPRASIVQVTTGFSGGGSGHGWSDAGSGGSLDVGAGPVVVELRPRTEPGEMGAGFRGFIGHRSAAAGWLRFGAVNDHGETMLSWAASAAPRAASVRGDDVVEWREADHPGVVAHAPVLTLSTGTSYDLDVVGRFLGAFKVGSAPAAVTSPAGVQEELGPGTAYYFETLTSGRWRFEVGSHVDLSADRARLFGARLPRFGIAP